ncbi:GNAT family N-acetyltransferase [Cellulomonas sp. URHE0023]|uniref:GNAT family N-acetyltransferase n=1 Tax=Cellulomonas sp. URHE0023 TaxID=1380354 RepID=UPI0012DC6FF7|nr:GNAT family N-acetyltransferase [Cellulomonas sp. URHE0023]
MDSDELRTAMNEIRMAVFVGEQGVDPEVELDELDDDPATLHVVALDDDGSALGTARLLPPHHSGEPAHIGRVAVRAAARGLGVGARLMAALEAAALERFGVDGTVAVELSAQEQALGFYARLGYVARPDRYLSENIWHRDALKVVRVTDTSSE